MTTRTTSALEAYNGVLGRQIQKKGNFFRFVETLREEEYEKSKKFEVLIESGGTVGAKRSTKYFETRSVKIAEATELLEKGKITPMLFLNRLAFQRNKVMDDMDPKESIFEEDDIAIDDGDDGNVEEIPVPAEQDDNEEDSTVGQGTMCIICQVSAPNTAFLPCKHMKCCSECILKLQAQCIASNNRKLKCPYCREFVEDTLTLYV